MKEKILTLIIPAYNMEKYLDRCLSSLVVNDESMGRFEALVINDGSKDGTSEIGRRYEGAYPDTFRVIDKENGHYGSCVNRGLAEAKGTFVKILDADDSFDNDVFTSFLDFLMTEDVKTRADVIISDYTEVDNRRTPLKTISFSKHDHSFSKNDLTSNDKKEWFIHALTYRTSILREQNYRQIEGISYTDQEWAFIPMAYASVLFSFGKPLYLYTKGVENQSVEPAIHAKNIWMEMNVIKEIILFYSGALPASAKERAPFLRDRLLIIVESIYQLCLLTLRKYKVPLDALEDFDNCLKTNCPGEYAITNRYSTTIAKMKFFPIRNWRENKRGIMLLQNLAYDFADWYNNLKLNH